MSQLRPFERWTVSSSGAASVMVMSRLSVQSFGERLVEVVDDVVRLLDADAETHEPRQHAGVGELLLAELRVGGGCRMDDERLRVADVGEVAGQVDALDETLTDLAAALSRRRLDPEAEH